MVVRGRSKNAPTGLIVALNLFVGEDIILPSFYKIKSISVSAGHPERAKRAELLGGRAVI